MPKSSNSPATALVKEIRTSLDARVERMERVERAEEKGRPAGSSGSGRNAIRALGVPTAVVVEVAREFVARHQAGLDYAAAVDLLEVSASRKVREEILAAIEVLETFRDSFEPGLLVRLDKCTAIADDFEIAEALGARVAAVVLALDPAKVATVRKWARLRSAGRRRLALLAAMGLVSGGRRDAAVALDLCEILLHEEHPVLVAEVAALLKTTTRIDAKAVQDFLFRRSVDGNPEILRAGSENLDAARRAALIAKLEAQALSAASSLVAVTR